MARAKRFHCENTSTPKSKNMFLLYFRKYKTKIKFTTFGGSLMFIDIIVNQLFYL